MRSDGHAFAYYIYSSRLKLQPMARTFFRLQSQLENMPPTERHGTGIAHATTGNPFAFPDRPVPQAACYNVSCHCRIALIPSGQLAPWLRGRHNGPTGKHWLKMNLAFQLGLLVGAVYLMTPLISLLLQNSRVIACTVP